MKISETDVEYVAKLAMLEVADNEKKELAEQLSQMQHHELPSGWDKDLPTFPAAISA